MLVYGDELSRTQNGNNNPYDVDSVATWNNYDMIASDDPQSLPTGYATSYDDNLGADANRDGRNAFFLFLRSVLAMRAAHPALRQGDYAMPIAFARPDGSAGFDSHRDLAGRVLLSGSAVGDVDFLVLSNMGWTDQTFTLPAGPRWARLVDTAAWAEPAGNAWDERAATTIAGNYFVHARSLVVLAAQ